MREIFPKCRDAIKLVMSISLISFFVSCRSKEKINKIDYSGFLEKKIVLAGIGRNYEQKDTLAMLTIKVPNRLDTFYQWQDHSDCSNCGYSKYRFSDKNYPQYAESGFFYAIQPDSTYQFNIWHTPFREAPDTVDLKPVTKELTEIYSQYQTTATSFDTSRVNYIIKEFKVINDRSFIITAFLSKSSYLTWKPACFVVATTKLKSRELIFIAECSGKDTTGFIDSFYKTILSIKIEEKQ